jgi:hypothetical protein
MRQKALGLAAWALLFATPATAVKPGGSLFIKTKDTKVLAKADARAKVQTVLQPGTEVKWIGADKANRKFHSIETLDGKKGFALQQNLSPSKPSTEYLGKDDGKPIDAQAFASSGAATKALSEAALKYGEGQPSMEELTKGLMTAESVAASVSPADGRDYTTRATQGAK